MKQDKLSNTKRGIRHKFTTTKVGDYVNSSSKITNLIDRNQSILKIYPEDFEYLVVKI